MMAWTISRAARFVFALVSFGGVAACATSSPIQDPAGAGGNDPNSPNLENGNVCILHNCDADAQCGGCPNGRTKCLVAEHRCVACDADTGKGCTGDLVCSKYGVCIPADATCPVDDRGSPTVTCKDNSDCLACDPLHQVCDPTSHQCVACTSNDTSACQSTEQCVSGHCADKCPASCTSDGDCGQCGSNGNEARACNAHKCAECSPTRPCKNGETCTPQGTCVAKCGTDGKGACDDSSDCSQCRGGATTCHKPINGGAGKCVPAATGCSDLGQGVAVLPEPFSKVTQTCSSDANCGGVGVDFNVGKMLRDLTGLKGIKDANITYGMNVCADVTLSAGSAELSCGVCVPCKVDTDCKPIDIDQVAGKAFGPLGSIGAAVLLDQVFGQNEHKVQMYCEPVAGGYGVCSPCSDFLKGCGSNSGFGSGDPKGGAGQCDHDECSSGGPLKTSCTPCTSTVCSLDPYCCTKTWDSTCINEAHEYCGSTLSCDGSPGGGTPGGGATCSHGECTIGSALDPNCSSCVSAVCAADEYCCTKTWDSTCIDQVSQYCTPGC